MAISGLNINPRSGTGGGSVQVTCPSNPSTSERYDSIVVRTTSGLSKSVGVQQAGRELNLTLTSLDLTYGSVSRGGTLIANGYLQGTDADGIYVYVEHISGSYSGNIDELNSYVNAKYDSLQSTRIGAITEDNSNLLEFSQELYPTNPNLIFYMSFNQSAKTGTYSLNVIGYNRATGQRGNSTIRDFQVI